LKDESFLSFWGGIHQNLNAGMLKDTLQNLAQLVPTEGVARPASGWYFFAEHLILPLNFGSKKRFDWII